MSVHQFLQRVVYLHLFRPGELMCGAATRAKTPGHSGRQTRRRRCDRPDGQSTSLYQNCVKPFREKIFASVFRKNVILCRHTASTGGTYRDRHMRGRRGAVDASAHGRSQGARTSGLEADERSRAVPIPRRWNQACGRRTRQATEAKEPGTPRRPRIRRKPSRRECRRAFGCTCELPVCVFAQFAAHEARGCNGTRHSLRPHFPGGRTCSRTRARRAAGTNARALKFPIAP